MQSEPLFRLHYKKPIFKCIYISDHKYTKLFCFNPPIETILYLLYINPHFAPKDAKYTFTPLSRFEKK